MENTGNIQQFTNSQIIEKIQYFIDTNNGDVGRLYHILEHFKQNKPLYQSDKNYLESKLNISFEIIDEKKPNDNPVLSKIQLMMNAETGDPGRLQHIYDMIYQNKPLYHSDQVYLESKLNVQNTPPENNLLTTFEHSKNRYSAPKKETIFEVNLPPTKHTIQKLRGSMPKNWSPPENNLNELTGIYEKIKTEEELLAEKKKEHDQLQLQRSKLSQLILNRKDYEKQVLLEKTLIESQIKEEHLSIQTQTKLSEQILSQKAELEQVKSERNELMKKISVEKEKVAKDLEFQKKQLIQTKLEQEEIEKQIKNEQIQLAKMAEEQKSNLLKQSKIAREINEKQTDLEKTKKEYEDIVSQVNLEKSKLDESEKLKKLIISQ